MSISPIYREWASENKDGTIPKAVELLSSNNLKHDSKIDEDGNNLLHLACKFGLIDDVKFLLQYDINVNTPNNLGDTPLHLVIKYSSRRKSIYDLKKLLSKKIYFNEEERDENFFLHLSFEEKRNVLKQKENDIQEIIALLLQNNSDVNLQNAEGETALHLATSWVSVDYFDLLLLSMPDLNIQDNKGKTVLQF